MSTKSYQKAATPLNDERRPSRIMRFPQVKEVTGFSRTTLWRQVKEGLFPAPVKIGSGRNVGWLENEVAEWQANLPRATNLS